MDEDKLRASVDRAYRAHRELEETKAAFDALDADYTRLWKNARTADERERVWLAAKVLEKVREHLSHVVAGGKLAEHELKQINTAGEPPKRRWFPNVV